MKRDHRVEPVRPAVVAHLFLVAAVVAATVGAATGVTRADSTPTASTSTAPAKRFVIEPMHTFPSLEMTHLGISTWRGKFNRTRGTIELDRTARTGRVEVEVEVASIDWGLDLMNEYSLRPDWLDAAQHPVMRYVGAIEFDDTRPAALVGELTLRGVTRPLRLSIDHFACVPHPLTKRELCGADASGELHRADFGMTQYADGELGRIRFRVQVEANPVEDPV